MPAIAPELQLQFMFAGLDGQTALTGAAAGPPATRRRLSPSESVPAVTTANRSTSFNGEALQYLVKPDPLILRGTTALLRENLLVKMSLVQIDSLRAAFVHVDDLRVIET